VDLALVAVAHWTTHDGAPRLMPNFHEVIVVREYAVSVHGSDDELRRKGHSWARVRCAIRSLCSINSRARGTTKSEVLLSKLMLEKVKTFMQLVNRTLVKTRRDMAGRDTSLIIAEPWALPNLATRSKGFETITSKWYYWPIRSIYSRKR